MKRCIALLSLLTLTAPVPALTIRVGADPGCDTSSLAVALTRAKANPGADTIHIARNQVYANQELFVDSDVTLRGGYTSCDAPAPDGRTELAGSGSWAVVTAWTDTPDGIVVRLEGLDIRNGGAGGDIGDFGGVSVGGRTRVAIADARIHDNVAIVGGGVSVNGTNAIVDVEHTVEIDNNRASLGGGFGVAGGTLRLRPYAVVIRDNRAADGGGVYVDAGLVSVGSDPDIARPVDGLLVRNNTASNRGGGIHVRGTFGKLLAESTVIRDNTAGIEGGGAYGSDGGYIQFTRYSMGPQRPCSAEQECLRLSGNTAPRGGGIALAAGATGALFHSMIRDNLADDGPAISVRGQNSELRLLGSIVARNRCVGGNTMCAPIRTTAGKLRFTYTTIADNTAGASIPSPIFADGSSGDSITQYAFYSTLISGHTQLYAQNGAATTHTGDCLIMSAGQIWSGLSRSDIAPIEFVDAPRGNYRLRPGNSAIDYCTSGLAPTDDPDIDGTVRGIESPGNANDFGTFDVGAYEYERLFAGGFEGLR